MARSDVSFGTATTAVVGEAEIAGLSAANSSPAPLGKLVAFTANVAAGSNVAYNWAFGDGAIGSRGTLMHIYSAVGIYTAVVTTSNSVSVLTTTALVTITDGTITSLVAANLNSHASAGSDATHRDRGSR